MVRNSTKLWIMDKSKTNVVADQLNAYAHNRLKQFDIPLAPEGTTFQKRVWEELSNIPFGTTRTYSDLAVALGDPNLSRAVGAANGKNPIMIIIPCHRVIGKDLTLTGYAGGLEMKRTLLELEGILTGYLPGFL